MKGGFISTAFKTWLAGDVVQWFSKGLAGTVHYRRREGEREQGEKEKERERGTGRKC